MAKKVNALRLEQETRGHAEVTNRLPAKVSPALYLMQLRLTKMKISPLKRKLPITGNAETRDQIEHAVKIRHVV
ncbi:MAG: hypothetical protein PHY43_10465 [Verrucomicrobiales bacterium]|nr:hypothetical protein [Verrucomicrobiales bacterium]